MNELVRSGQVNMRNNRIIMYYLEVKSNSHLLCQQTNQTMSHETRLIHNLKTGVKCTPEDIESPAFVL